MALANGAVVEANDVAQAGWFFLVGPLNASPHFLPQVPINLIVLIIKAVYQYNTMAV